MAVIEEKKSKTEKVEEVITAVYKVNLHCEQCARDIRRPLLRTQGVHRMEYDIDKNEIKVKGEIDVIKIHKLVEKYSKKKVQLISPQVKVKEKTETEKKVVKETKEVIYITTVKVHMHCEKCESDLKKKLLKHRGIHSVKTNYKTKTLIVQGTIESEKLLVYLRKKVHKSAEIIKQEQKEEKKVEVKKEETKVEVKKEEKKVEVKKEEVKKEVKSSETTTEIAEFKTEKKVEVKTKEGSGYFIHYVYAPQLFSDENPNACLIM